MQGDAVRARLANEVRSVEEARDNAAGSKPYSVEAAEQLSSDLARLGIASDGSTYLDYFRRLITGVVTSPA
jgi:WASH complex subunit 7